MNTARSGRKDLNGLVIWKTFDRELSPEEIDREVRALESEGFEFGKVLNSETTIVMMSSDGLAFSKSHLRQVDVRWKRLIETNTQLNSVVRTLSHKKLEEWEN